MVEKLNELARNSSVRSHEDDEDEDDEDPSDAEDSFEERNLFSPERSLPDLISNPVNRTHLDQTSSTEVTPPPPSLFSPLHPCLCLCLCLSVSIVKQCPLSIFLSEVHRSSPLRWDISLSISNVPLKSVKKRDERSAPFLFRSM